MLSRIALVLPWRSMEIEEGVAPSGNVRRKLFFGLGVLRQVKLIVLDEPTNHLDLPSIRCLEAALAECAGALLLISHDRMFLEKTCSIHWHIADGMLKKGFFAR